MKKFLTTISLILILLPNIAFAEDELETSPIVDEILEEWKYVEEAGDCALQAFNSLDEFFITSINPEKSRWIFSIPLYPECVARDILAIGDQMERIGTDIRASAFSCQNERVENLEERYFRLAAEQAYLYALFEIDGTKPVFFFSNNIQGSSGDIESGVNGWAIRSDNQVKEDVFKEAYFKNRSDEQKDQIFNEIKIKYADKMEEYKTCATQGIDDLAAKIEEFKERLGGFDVALEELERQKALLKKLPYKDLEQEKATEKAGSPANLDVEYTFGGVVKDTISSFVSTKINGLTPTSASRELIREAKKGFKNPAGVTVTNTFATFSNSQRQVRKNFETTDELARYFAELREGSDYIEREFYKAVSSENPGDKSLNFLLRETIVNELTQLENCTGDVEDKQCKKN